MTFRCNVICRGQTNEATTNDDHGFLHGLCSDPNDDELGSRYTGRCQYLALGVGAYWKTPNLAHRHLRVCVPFMRASVENVLVHIA